jgi:hypothetical protein
MGKLPEAIGRMKMFGTIVQFCKCDVCQAFLKTERGTMPTKLGRILSEVSELSDVVDVETIVDAS